MTRFTVHVDHKINDEDGTTSFPVEARSVHAGSDWITFHSTEQAFVYSVLAGFPTRRVIAVVQDEE
jgi:hypothetical protein